jgi:hypothetical protein
MTFCRIHHEHLTVEIEKHLECRVVPLGHAVRLSQ